MSNTALVLFPTHTSWAWSTIYSQAHLQTPQVWYHGEHQHHSFVLSELPFLLLCRCNFFNSETQWKAQLPFLLLHFYRWRKELSYMAFGIFTESTEGKEWWVDCLVSNTKGFFQFPDDGRKRSTFSDMPNTNNIYGKIRTYLSLPFPLKAHEGHRR